MRKISWLDHIVNLVVVITGITVAFSLNNWKSGNDRARVEKEYFKSFTLDLDQDIENLDSLLIDDSLQAKALEKLLNFDENINIDETGGIDDSTLSAVNRLAQLNTFLAQNTTYESMKSSGKFEVLSDFQIKMNILGYYHTAYDELFLIDGYYRKNYDNNILPFFIDEMSNFSKDLPDIILSGRFRTIVQVHLIMLEQKMDAGRKCLNKAKKLRDELTKLLAD